MKLASLVRLLGTLFVILSLASAAAEEENSEQAVLAWWPKGATLDLGIRFSQSKVTIKDSSSKAVLAELSSVSLPSPSFVFSSRFDTWGSTRFGYKYKFGFSWFTIRTQKVGNELVDLGTGADGYGVYFTPIAGYLFGDQESKNGRGKSLLIGLGVGAGYLISSGTVQLTESTNEVKSFNFNQPTFAFQLVLDANINNWNFGINIGGPTVDDGDFNYEFFDVSANVAYSFSKEDFSPAGRPKVTKNDEFFANTASFFVAFRNLPIISNEKFNVSNEQKTSTGVGFAYSLQPKHWPLALAVDFSYIQASPVSANTDILESGTFSDVTLEATLIESHFGLLAQRAFESPRWSWSAGGGVATFHTSVEGTKNTTAIQDSSFDFGYWLGGGIHWHFKNKSLSASLDARLVSVQTELLGVFEEGTKGNFRLGFNYHF